MIFLLHVEWPEMPPYKLLLTYYVWRIVWRHAVASCGLATFFITFTKVFFNFCDTQRFLTFFKIFIWTFFHIYAVMPACVDRYYDTEIAAKVSSLLRLLTKTDGEEQSVQQVHNDNAIRSPIRSPVVVDDPAHLPRGHRSKPPVRPAWPDDRPPHFQVAKLPTFVSLFLSNTTQGRLNQWAHWARAQGLRIFFSFWRAPTGCGEIFFLNWLSYNLRKD